MESDEEGAERNDGTQPTFIGTIEGGSNPGREVFDLREGPESGGGNQAT